jgi:preprotein translocase subunit YajC
MDRRRKRLFLFVLSVVVLAMLLLSTGLSELEFLAGQPFPLVYSPEGVWGTFGGLLPVTLFEVVFRVLVAIAVLILPFSIIYFLTSREARKRVLLDFLRLLPFLVIVYVLAQRVQLGTFSPEQDVLQVSPGDSSAAPVVDGDVVPPQWFSQVTSVGLALFVAIVLVGVGWFIWRRRQRRTTPLEQLAQQAEEAIEAIQAGADLRNTVMRCYYEMSRVLRQQRGIRRHQAMTPREFVALLEEAGLPSGAVWRLTELFEQVRYGAKAPDQAEETQALACLETIVEFCRSAG